MKRLAGLFGSHNEAASDDERTVARQLVVLGDPGTGKTHLIQAMTTGCSVPEWWEPHLDGPEGLIEVDLKSEAFTVNTLPAEGEPDGEQDAPDASTSNSQAKRQILRVQCREALTSEEYQLARTLYYPGTDVMAICVAVNDPVSLSNAVDKWYPEILYHMHTVPVLLLVGTKADLRQGLEENENNFITQERVLEVVQRLRAVGYVECSGRTFEGVQEVTNVLARMSLQPQHKTKQDDCILA